MTKREVIAFLGRSKRTVETYISAGMLPVSYVNGPHGKQAEFDPAAVEALKRELETPMVRATPAETAVQAIAAPLTPLAQSLVAALRSSLPAEPYTPWLDLASAAKYSGLTKAWLLREAQAGQGSIAVRDMGRNARGGRWRFRRDDLGLAE